MKFISFFLLLLTTQLSAQPDRVYLTWDLSKPASFPGGQLAFRDYFKNTPYPTDTTIRPSGNRLVVGFVVEKDGRSADLRFFQTPGPAFTAAVITAMQGMKWNWAEANGHPVRQLMFLCFFFHHPTKRVVVQEHYLHVSDYASLQAIDPADYPKLGFPTEERFMGYNPEDTLAAKQRYPEAAKAAGVQGEVGVTATLQPDGSLTDLTLLNDIGYGCGEEALRLTRLLKNWVPAQVFDSTYASSHEFIYVFCPDPAAIETSDKLYTEGEILPPDSKYDNQLLAHTKPVFLNAKYVLGEDFNLVPYNNAMVEVNFIVEKNGKASAIEVGGNASENQRALARKFIETKEWTASRCCNRPCRMQIKRFLYFHRGLEENSCQHVAQLVFSKSALPVAQLWSDIRGDTLFESVEVDQPAVFRFGPKSIEELVVLHWPRYRSELPPGGEILIRVLVPENGNVRYMELISGVGAEVDKKALAVLKKTSDYWTPAYKDGYKVSSWSVVRIGR